MVFAVLIAKNCNILLNSDTIIFIFTLASKSRYWLDNFQCCFFMKTLLNRSNILNLSHQIIKQRSWKANIWIFKWPKCAVRRECHLVGCIDIQVVAVARLTFMFVIAENYRMKFVINTRIVVNQQPFGCKNLL